VTDLGGRLTARNSDGGGAVFEMQLPILDSGLGPGLGNKQEAAE
jgi:two-component system C4-dicarboxylate transport sensor histidine kinase DctB